MQESGIVENLVTQFSSALDCFRELVQNSIDAGSPQVEIWMEYEQGEGHEGVIAIHVDDFGEGMDEAIIDGQLTKLFASTKENDLTKIGKFGIGFVSVFALRPKGVLVHTGRGGEYWEIFFHEDRSFSKTRLELPVEGTQITLFLAGDYHRYRELVGGVRDTLRHWCSHSETEVTFEDRSPLDDDLSQLEQINEAFTVPGECVTRVVHQGTEIVLAYTPEPLYGFYNRGLTLAFTRHGEDALFERHRRYAHIAFKLKSRYLEHTLSRETVMRDANYEKAIQLMDAAAGGELLEALLGQLEALIQQPSWGQGEINAYVRLMQFLAMEPVSSLEVASTRRILRLVDGRPMTLERMLELWERDDRLLLAAERTALTDSLASEQIPVIYGLAPRGPESMLRVVGQVFVRHASHVLGASIKQHALGVLRWMGVSVMKIESRLMEGMLHPDQVYLPVELDDTVEAPMRELVEAASQLLHKVDAGYRELGTCRVVSLSSEEAPLFVVAPKLARHMARPTQVKQKRRMEAAVNRDHRQLKALLALHQRSPSMAAYCLAKALLLDQDRLIERDTQLMQHAWQLAGDAAP